MQLLEGLRPMEEKLLRIILGASAFMTFENYEPSSFMTKIRSELQRRVAFMEDIRQQMRESFAEKISSIDNEKADNRKQEASARP